MRFMNSRTLIVAATLLGGLGVASAQSGTPAAPAPTTEPPVAAVTTPREVQLSPEQRLEQSNLFLQKMEQSAVLVRQQLAQARAARDVVKVLCLNDKLNQIDVAYRSARDRVDTLKRSVEQKDEDGSRHEYAVLQVLNDRVATLVSEANQCIGEEAGFIGDSKVTVSVDPTVPDTNPDDVGYDQDVVDGPVLSSPIR